jgi:cholesterol transport system auxiliary component
MYPLNAIVLTTLLLTGCSVAPTPPIQEYTLLGEESPHPAPSVQSPKILTVAPPKALRAYAGKQIVYQKNPHEIDAYLYSRWSDTPATMVHRSLLRSLHQHSLFSSAIPTSSQVQGDWLLESELDAFDHRIRDEKSEALIDITYRLIDTQAKRPISIKRFTITSPSRTSDAAGGVQALRNAQNELNHQCLAWLTTLIKENQ